MPRPILSLFDAGPDMMQMGTEALRIISLGFAVSTVGIVLCGAFEALGKGVYSLVISLVRQLLIIPPMSFVLMRFLGLTGVWITFPAAECVAAAVAVILFKKNWKQEKKVTMF